MEGRRRGLHSIVVFSAVGAILLSACGGGSSTTGQTSGPINMGEIYPMTGKAAVPGERWNRGDIIATKEINANGGILGGQIQQFLQDTAGDAVDAVPALRLLQTHNLTFLMGPSSLEFSALQPSIDGLGIPDMAMIPGAQYDLINDPSVFRPISGDTVEAHTLAFYANHIGCTKAAFFMENIESAQGYVAPTTAGFTAHGGTVVYNSPLVPHQTSYRSEILKAFAGNPQCAFVQTDQQTTGTLFSNLQQLGHLNIPYIGTDAFSDPTIFKAAGSAAAQYLVGTVAVNATGPASDHFNALYKAQYSTSNADPDPTFFAAAAYDGVVVFALAMNAANSTDPKVWIKKVLSVVGESGTECSTYKDCVALLKQGKTIDYEGASSNMDFDVHHDIYTPFNIITWATGTQTTVLAVASAQVAGF